MDIIFVNLEDSESSDLHRLMLHLKGKKKIKKKNNKYVTQSNLGIYFTLKKFKKLYANNKFKILGPILNEEFNLLEESYCLSHIQNHFEYIIKDHSTTIDILPAKILIKKKLKI